MSCGCGKISREHRRDECRSPAFRCRSPCSPRQDCGRELCVRRPYADCGPCGYDRVGCGPCGGAGWGYGAGCGPCGPWGYPGVGCGPCGPWGGVGVGFVYETPYAVAGFPVVGAGVTSVAVVNPWGCGPCGPYGRYW